MRIVHVTDTFLPRLGGIELHVADLAGRQAAAGHEVTILTAEAPAPRAGADRVPAGVRVERVRTVGWGLGSGAWIRPVIAHTAPDIVHAHLTVGSPLTWGVLRNSPNVPAIATVHSLLPRAPRLVRAGIRLVGLPESRITFTAVSEVAAARLRPALAGGSRVHVLHNGIDSSAWQVRHEPSAGFNILSVGRLAARKRPLVLVDALAGLSRIRPDLDWTATLVGDGAQRAKVLDAVRSHGLERRVRLVGTLRRDEIRALLARTDVFVAPATLESFGIAALEARCAGVPIIGMAASGLTEFVRDGVDGLLVDHDRDIATALDRLASDPGLRALVRRHNSTTAVPMEWADVLREHEVLYAEAIRTAPGRVGV